MWIREINRQIFNRIYSKSKIKGYLSVTEKLFISRTSCHESYGQIHKSIWKCHSLKYWVVETIYRCQSFLLKREFQVSKRHELPSRWKQDEVGNTPFFFESFQVLHRSLGEILHRSDIFVNLLNEKALWEASLKLGISRSLTSFRWNAKSSTSCFKMGNLLPGNGWKRWLGVNWYPWYPIWTVEHCISWVSN